MALIAIKKIINPRELREFLKIDEKSMNDLKSYFSSETFATSIFFLQFSEIPATLSVYFEN
jgi:hypothetical protein